MTGIDKSLLRQLLLIGNAWEIGDYQLDLRKRRCDVWVAPEVERGWFGRPRKASAVRTEQHTWQHVALGPVRFVLHVNAPVGVDLSRSSWTGDPGMPFTHALAQQVFALFNEGMELTAICKMMGLSLNDVWRYRFAIDNGLVQSQASAAAAPSPAGAAARVDIETSGSTAVPDVADPVWLRVVSGDLKLDIKVLSLKLMLTRVRSQLEVISDDEVRLLKLRDLHRYFVKNERVLVHELSQLRMG